MSKSKRQKRRNGWKILFKYLFEYKKSVILLSILGVISALANGTVPYIIGKFFDAVLDPSALVFVGTQIEMPTWAFLIGIFATVQIVADVVDWRSAKEQRRVGLQMYSNYLTRAFEKLTSFSLSFHSNKKHGGVIDVLDRAGGTIDSLIVNMIAPLTPQFFSLIIGFVIVFGMNVILGGILLGGIFVYIMTLISVVAPLDQLTKKGNKGWRTAFENIYDAILNIEAVKRFATEKNENIKIRNSLVNNAARVWYAIEVIFSNISFYQRIIVTLTRVSIFVVSVTFVQNGTITIGELIAFNGYAAMVFGPFVTLGMNWHRIQSGLVIIEDAEKLLNTKPEIYEPKNAVKMDSIRGDVSFENVYFHYTKKDGNVLKGVSLNVKAGEIVALVGESGVGKSTLVELISGYYFAQKGKVLVDGVDVKRIALKELRGAIAVVPQEVALFNDTVLANIKYGSFKATEKEVKEAARKAHADMFIEKFPKKYKQMVGERGVKLSVGQKQRIAIARAILRDPKILILDEPTSALDSKTEHFITESLEELMRGRTTFIVAHRLSTVREADKIIVFEKGKVVESGKHKDLIKKENGVYKRLHDLQIGLS
ncbi:ABC transporter ATP-binding protein [Patescibacteria group bacterium]